MRYERPQSTETTREVPQPRSSSRPRSGGPERPVKSRSSRPNPRDYSRELADLRPLTDREADALRTIGQFRTISAADLIASRGERTLRNMKELGLLRSHYVGGENINAGRKTKASRGGSHNRIQQKSTERLHVVTITNKGAAWLKANGYDERTTGKLRPGLVKAREAHHDARLYALTQQALTELRAKGNTPGQVTTDTVLKSRYQSEFHQQLKAGASKDEARDVAAAANQLAVVDGKVVIPDVRIEFERPDGERAYSDLELESESYRDGMRAAKDKAGFSSYTPSANGGFQQRSAGFQPGKGGSGMDPDHIGRLLGR